MAPEMIEVLFSIGGFVLAAIGLPVLYLQLRDLKRSVQGGVHAAMYVQAADFRSHLIEYPHLRPYFFDGVEIAPDHEDYARTLTIAELILNYLEHISVMAEAFGEANRPALDRFCAEALQRSPILRQHLQGSPASYSDALLRRLGRGA